MHEEEKQQIEHSLVRDTLLALLVEARETLEPPTSTQKAKKEALTNEALVMKRQNKAHKSE